MPRSRRAFFRERLVFAAGPAGEGGGEGAEHDGFRDVVVHARREAALAVALHGVRGHGDDRGAGRVGDAADGGGMNAWPFITAAYGITAAASIALALVAWRAMRRAEAAAEKLTRR